MLEEHPSAYGFCRQGVFGLFDLRDVPIGAEHAHRLAGDIPLHAGQGVDVAHGSIRPKHAELGAVFFFLAKRLLEFGLRALPVIRMKPCRPSLVSAAKPRAGDSVEAEHLVIPDHRIGGGIVIPNPDATRLGGQGQALGGVLQIRCKPPGQPSGVVTGVLQRVNQAGEQQAKERSRRRPHPRLRCIPRRWPGCCLG